jgi:PAS domain S-box-containing protein
MASLQSSTWELPVGVCRIDLTGTVVECNPMCAELFGLAPEGTALGRPIDEFTRHGHNEGEVCTDSSCLAFDAASNGTPRSRDVLYLLGADNRSRVVECWVRPWISDEVPVGTSFFFVDMAASARREAELRASLKALEQSVGERTDQLLAREALIGIFYEHSSECHAVLIDTGNGQFRYEEVNPSTLKLYGKTREEVIGRTTDEIFGAERAAVLNQHLTACLASGLPYRYERMHGEGIVEAVATPVPHELGTLQRIVVSARDVTRQRRLEEQLRQAQKMEAVGQLTGGLAHDFNNLLAIISGSIEVFKKRIELGKPEAVERYVDAAQNATRRAAALTQRLLAFSRRQTLDPKPTDVNRLVAGMEDLLRRTLGPEITLEVVGAGGLWATLVDPPQLENALLNLCINARDAMPDGGRLTIETANRWLDERVARERELPPGQYISLCVTDTGTGMTPEVVARAFDPFFTTKPIGQGTGLGLSMIYGFVRQSGGQVRIYSELGQGTTLCLYFPRHVGALDTAEPFEPAGATDRGDGEVVVVIDDEPMVRMILVTVLEEAGYHVIECCDGPSGLKVLGAVEKVDLLITDVGLPGGLNGRQVADAARATRPELKVLFVTGYAENAVVGNGHLEPGMEVLTKPFTMASLAVKVSEILAR